MARKTLFEHLEDPDGLDDREAAARAGLSPSDVAGLRDALTTTPDPELVERLGQAQAKLRRHFDALLDGLNPTERALLAKRMARK